MWEGEKGGGRGEGLAGGVGGLLEDSSTPAIMKRGKRMRHFSTRKSDSECTQMMRYVYVGRK